MELHQTSTTQNRHARTLQTIPIHATKHDQITPDHQHQHHWNQQETWLIHTKTRRHHHKKNLGGGRNIGYISVGWWMGCIRHSPWRRSGPTWFSRWVTTKKQKWCQFLENLHKYSLKYIGFNHAKQIMGYHACFWDILTNITHEIETKPHIITHLG